MIEFQNKDIALSKCKLSVVSVFFAYMGIQPLGKNKK